MNMGELYDLARSFLGIYSRKILGKETVKFIAAPELDCGYLCGGKARYGFNRDIQ